MRRRGPMSRLDRLMIGALGALIGLGGVAVLAYAGPILRWSASW